MAIEIYQYVDSSKYASVAIWATGSHNIGDLCRPNAATEGNERVHVCVVAGTSSGTEPAGLSGTSRGAQTTDSGGVVWQECTGRPAMNGSNLKTVNWASIGAATVVAVGTIIKDAGATNFFIAGSVTSDAKTGASEPTWDTTPGDSTVDNHVTWICLGLFATFASAWTAPHRRIQNQALGGWNANGDICLVGSGHNMTVASNGSYTMSAVGTATARNQYLCVSNSVADPTTVTTGAKEITTGGGSIGINGGFLDMYGIEFDGGTTNPSTYGICNGNNASDASFTSCIFKSTATGSSYIIQMGTTAAGGTNVNVRFKSCYFRFATTSHGIQFNKINVFLEDCLYADTGSIPSILFRGAQAGCMSTVRIVGGDASTITGTLAAINYSEQKNMTIENLKLNASVAMTTGSFNGLNYGSFHLFDSDSGVANYRKYYSDFNGTIQNETSIVHTGGATDGTTPLSWNVASSANTTFRAPLKIGEFRFWNDVVGSSQTVTMELTTNTALNTADLGLSIDYLNSASFPTTAKVTSLPASTFDSTSALTTSSEVWGGTAQTYKYKIAVSYTPLMKGFVKGNLYLSKASSGAIYIDPKFKVSGVNFTRSEQLKGTYLTEVSSYPITNRGVRSGVEL